MAKQLNEIDRAQILTLYNEGLSTRKIANKIGTSQVTVVNTINKWIKHKTFKHLGGNGRPSICENDVVDAVLTENKDDAKKV